MTARVIRQTGAEIHIAMITVRPQPTYTTFVIFSAKTNGLYFNKLGQDTLFLSKENTPGEVSVLEVGRLYRMGFHTKQVGALQRCLLERGVQIGEVPRLEVCLFKGVCIAEGIP